MPYSNFQLLKSFDQLLVGDFGSDDIQRLGKVRDFQSERTGKAARQ
jgi:hypothetical protein